MKFKFKILKMKVYIMNYSGYPVGVFSRKKKLLEAYVRRCEKHREEIVKDLENALQGIYRSKYDILMDMDQSVMLKILRLFQGEYDSSHISFEDLSNCTDSDYTFCSLEMDS